MRHESVTAQLPSPSLDISIASGRRSVVETYQEVLPWPRTLTRNTKREKLSSPRQQLSRMVRQIKGALALVEAWREVDERELDALIADIYASRGRDMGRPVEFDDW